MVSVKDIMRVTAFQRSSSPDLFRPGLRSLKFTLDQRPFDALDEEALKRQDKISPFLLERISKGFVSVAKNADEECQDGGLFNLFDSGLIRSEHLPNRPCDDLRIPKLRVMYGKCLH